MLIGVVFGIVFGAAALFRARQFRSMEAVTMRHRRLGPDGIVIGGEGFVLARENAPAILLLHGAGDTPQSMRYLGDALYERGFHVVAPLLPGHGRTLREFARVSADDLTWAAEKSYREVRASHERVAVIGLSMGGALAVQLAAHHPDLAALGLLAPYLAMPPRIERMARLSRVWGVVLPAARSTDGKSVLDADEDARNLAYGVFTAAGLYALWETKRRAVAMLPRVTAPTLAIQSRQDNRISVADAERAFALLGSTDKHFEWVSGAGHIITVDFGRDGVIAQLAAFMEAHLPPRAPTPIALQTKL